MANYTVEAREMKGTSVTGYVLNNGSAKMRVDVDQMAFLVGRGLVQDCEGKVFRDTVIISGLNGLKLNKLPSIRSKDTEDNKVKGSYSVSDADINSKPEILYNITGIVKKGRVTMAYDTDTKGEISREQVIKDATEDKVGNLTTQNYNGKVLLRGVGINLKSLPVRQINSENELGQIQPPTKEVNLKDVYWEAIDELTRKVTSNILYKFSDGCHPQMEKEESTDEDFGCEITFVDKNNTEHKNCHMAKVTLRSMTKNSLICLMRLSIHGNDGEELDRSQHTVALTLDEKANAQILRDIALRLVSDLHDESLEKDSRKIAYDRWIDRMVSVFNTDGKGKLEQFVGAQFVKEIQNGGYIRFNCESKQTADDGAPLKFAEFCIRPNDNLETAELHSELGNYDNDDFYEEFNTNCRIKINEVDIKTDVMNAINNVMLKYNLHLNNNDTGIIKVNQLEKYMNKVTDTFKKSEKCKENLAKYACVRDTRKYREMHLGKGFESLMIYSFSNDNPGEFGYASSISFRMNVTKSIVDVKVDYKHFDEIRGSSTTSLSMNLQNIDKIEEALVEVVNKGFEQADFNSIPKEATKFIDELKNYGGYLSKFEELLKNHNVKYSWVKDTAFRTSLVWKLDKLINNKSFAGKVTIDAKDCKVGEDLMSIWLYINEDNEDNIEYKFNMNTHYGTEDIHNFDYYFKSLINYTNEYFNPDGISDSMLDLLKRVNKIFEGSAYPKAFARLAGINVNELRKRKSSKADYIDQYCAINEETKLKVYFTIVKSSDGVANLTIDVSNNSKQVLHESENVNIALGDEMIYGVISDLVVNTCAKVEDALTPEIAAKFMQGLLESDGYIKKIINALDTGMKNGNPKVDYKLRNEKYKLGLAWSIVKDKGGEGACGGSFLIMTRASKNNRNRINIDVNIQPKNMKNVPPLHKNYDITFDFDSETQRILDSDFFDLYNSILAELGMQ